MKFCWNVKHPLSGLIKTRKHRVVQWQVNLDSVYKRYKTPRRFPPKIPLQTYCDASNHLGMIIFAPVPLRCPTSQSRNGCQVLFGLERIKLSPPCCVLIYCFRHFHIGFILTHSAAAWGSRASWLGPHKMALDGAQCRHLRGMRCPPHAAKPWETRSEITMPLRIPALDSLP